MREMKWQINVNRRRPFITGLHGRGRVYGSARTRRASWVYADTLRIRVHVRVRVRTGRARPRGCCVRAVGPSTRRFIELEKRYRKNSKLY